MRTFMVLGSDRAAQAFFKLHGLHTSSSTDRLIPGRDAVVLWDASRLSPAEKRQADVYKRFLRAGGEIVVLATSSWDWKELCEVKVSHAPRFSRVFPYQDLKGSVLEGIDPQWLIRWNGLPGTVGRGSLEGTAIERAEKILWGREPETTVMAVIPADSGDGRIVFTQLDLQSRVDRSKASFDPVAERILLRLLGR
jgi:hypothetical protein